MNILVECHHNYEDDMILFMVDTDKLDKNKSEDVPIIDAIDKALQPDSNRQVEISVNLYDTIENNMYNSGSYVSFQFEGKTIDKHIYMFWS